MRRIDADKLIADIEKYNLSDGKFQHWVEIQPTIDAEPRWIPVTERLPETHKKESIFEDDYKCSDAVIASLAEPFEGNVVEQHEEFVKVVRCKDCKHWKKLMPEDPDGDERCMLMELYDGREPNDYCSYGERREDERS